MTPEDFSSIANDENVKVIGIGTWMNLMGLNARISRAELTKTLLEWCNSHTVLYYCRPSRSYSLKESIQWAKEVGASTLMVENLG